MKNIYGAVIIVMIVALLTACGKSAATWQEQCDLGMQYLTEGNYEQAVVAFTAAIEIDAKDIQAYTGLVQAYIGTGDYEAAVLVAGQGAEALGDSQQEQADGAVEEFTAVLLTLGELCLEESQYELAVTVFSLTIEVNPELVDAYIGRAEVYVMLAESEAVGDVQDTSDDGSETTGDGQESAEEVDEKQKALEDYQKALELIREGETGSLTEDELEELIGELKGTTATETDNTIAPTETDVIVTTYLSGNVMMDSGNEYPLWSSATLPGNENILRLSIRSITVLDSLEDMPADAWDISQNGDGSVMAWVTVSDDVEDLPELSYYDMTTQSEHSYYEWVTEFYDFYIAGEGGVDAPANSRYLFGGYILARTMDLTYLYTGFVTDMSGMFMYTVDEKNMEGTSYLEYLKIDNFDTSNVTDMSSMFSGCWMLKELDISHFNTEKVTDMSLMFFYCNELSDLDLSSFDTGKVTNMYAMFADCWCLTALDLSNFNTENVTNMGSMFADCSAVTFLNVSSFDTKNVADMSRMFEYCENLAVLDITSFETENVTDMHWMFEGCASLTSLDVSGFDTSSCNDMSDMFLNCGNLSVDISGFDFSSLNTYTTDYSAYLGLTD